jgi:hypothetical protein
MVTGATLSLCHFEGPEPGRHSFRNNMGDDLNSSSPTFFCHTAYSSGTQHFKALVWTHYCQNVAFSPRVSSSETRDADNT